MKFTPRHLAGRRGQITRLIMRRPMAAAAALLVLVVDAGLGIAQGPSKQESSATFPPAPAPRAVLVDIEEESPSNQAARGGMNQMDVVPTAENINQWVFGREPNGARQHHQATIWREIRYIDEVCGLSAQQQRVLELAGAGEFENICEAARGLQAKCADRLHTQEELREIMNEVQPLRNQLQRRPLDPSSLLFKVLPTILDAAQAERLRSWTTNRQAWRRRSEIEACVAIIELHVPLRESQRKALIELLQAELRPLDPSDENDHPGVQQTAGVFAQMGTVAAEKFQAILDDAQWEVTQKIIADRGRMPLLQMPPRPQAARPRVEKVGPVDAGVLQELNEQRQLLLKNAQARPPRIRAVMRPAAPPPAAADAVDAEPTDTAEDSP